MIVENISIFAEYVLLNFEDGASLRRGGGACQDYDLVEQHTQLVAAVSLEIRGSGSLLHSSLGNLNLIPSNGRLLIFLKSGGRAVDRFVSGKARWTVKPRLACETTLKPSNFRRLVGSDCRSDYHSRLIYI